MELGDNYLNLDFLAFSWGIIWWVFSNPTGDSWGKCVGNCLVIVLGFIRFFGGGFSICVPSKTGKKGSSPLN